MSIISVGYVMQDMKIIDERERCDTRCAVMSWSKSENN